MVLKTKSSFLIALGLVGISLGAFAQNTQTNQINLADPSGFKSLGKSWSFAGDVLADLNESNLLKAVKGSGILVNQPGKKAPGTDLFTNFEHGDADIELDFLLAKGSNSGIYLQGRYELQLEDSWGIKVPGSSNNGGIYQRWDESRPEGRKGYDGAAPRQNASRAPGVWQHLSISFQAPRFDASGKKVENAKILRAELNGVIIHENVQLQGPTRGAVSNDEKSTGPLRIQGDHGAIAFRNIKVVNYDRPRPELVDMKYKVYKGRYEKEPDYSKLPPEAEGSSVIISSNVSGIPNEFLIRYTGKLKVKEPGAYNFSLIASGGEGLVKIDNKQVNTRRGHQPVNLAAGEFPFEIVYSKVVDWAKPALGLAVSGPGIREYIIGDESTGNSVDPILLNAPENTILRSFMDIPDAPRVTHAISVGSPDQVHYTYDLDHAALVQVWRGGFLDATPMWHERGDGSSRPLGAVQRFGKPVLSLAKLNSPEASWKNDTTGTNYRPKGYVLDKSQRPTFRYQIYGASVSDEVRVINNGEGLSRVINVENPSENLYVRIAEGSNIEMVTKGLYLVDGKSYYVRLDEADDVKPTVRDVNGRKELIAPITGKLSYSILF